MQESPEVNKFMQDKEMVLWTYKQGSIIKETLVILADIIF